MTRTVGRHAGEAGPRELPVPRGGRAAAALVAVAWGCQPPPPAPEGLDESARYLVRNFYADDAVFTAGLTGFMRWYEAEGYLLVGERATTDNTDAFTLTSLQPDDVAGLPLDELEGGRDVTEAFGVVSLAEMECTWQEAEALLVRTDQHVIFPDDWEDYDRTFESARGAYEQATAAGAFEPVPEPLDRFAADFDADPVDATVLLTRNQVKPISLLGIDIPAYEMVLDFRHGVHDLDGVPTPVVAILTFSPRAAYTGSGDTGLKQTYSMELDVGLPSGRTLRMLAVWAQPVSPLIAADDPLILNYAVNTSLDASDRMNEVCEGEAEVPGE